LSAVADLRTKPLEPELEKYYRTWMTTARKAVESLRADPRVDGDRVAVVGLSLGGFLASSVVVEYPELKVKALVNVFVALPAQQYAKVRKEKMKLPPILIIGAEDDDIVPEAFQRELFLLWRETNNRGEAHFYGNVGHAFVTDKKTNAVDLDLAMKEAL